MSRKVVLITNSSSGGGATAREWKALVSKLHERVGDFAEFSTSRPMEAEELTRRALERGADVVVAVGGAEPPSSF